MVMYRKDLADAAGVTVRDNDSWANIKGAAKAMHNPDKGVYGACLRGKPGWGDNRLGRQHGVHHNCCELLRWRLVR